MPLWGDAPAGGGGPALGDSVTSETSFGQSPSAGASTEASRADHTHGTPAEPTSGGGTVYAARLTLGTAWAVPASTLTRIPFDVTVRDDGGLTTGAATGTLVAPVVGWYQISAGWRNDSPLSGYWATFLRVNATTMAETQMDPGVASQSISTLVYLAADDVVDAAIFKSAATARDLNAQERTHLAMVRVG